MVQILPAAEPRRGGLRSFAEGLSGGLSQGLSSGMDFAQKMALQQTKEGGRHNFLQELMMGSQGQGSEGRIPNQLSLEQETALALKDPPAFNAYKHLQEGRQKEAEKIQEKENALESVSHMRDLIKKGGTGFSLKGLTPGGLGNRSALDTAALSLEKLAATMVGKGTLNQARFDYLKARLPSSWKTDTQNEQILDEWERELSRGKQPLSKKEEEGKKVKFNPKHPEHKAKAEQLFETYKDKEKVRQELKKEFEF